jgi:hypothetical protein
MTKRTQGSLCHTCRRNKTPYFYFECDECRHKRLVAAYYSSLRDDDKDGGIPWVVYVLVAIISFLVFTRVL